jgi:ADP-ribose pyrophosphatase YjhB (NUDIX family)
MHHIQKYILQKLTTSKQARFSEMRPPRVDSNVYSYHLLALQREYMIQKHDKAYGLTPKGLSYVERISVDAFEPRLQSKIITLLLVRDRTGKILLWPKSKQPFIGTWSLLSGKIHIDDVSVAAAVKRECLEKCNATPTNSLHIGDAYIRASIEGELISSVLAHVCLVDIPETAIFHDNVRWFTLQELQRLDTAPATKLIVDQALSADSFFFSEYDVSA